MLYGTLSEIDKLPGFYRSLRASGPTNFTFYPDACMCRNSSCGFERSCSKMETLCSVGFIVLYMYLVK